MTSPKAAVLALLAADPAVTLLANGRVRAGQSGQDRPAPRVVVWQIDRAGVDTLRGPSGLAQFRVQCDCYGRTDREASALAARVKALNGYPRRAADAGLTLAGGYAPVATADGVLLVSCVTVLDERDSPDQPRPGSETQQYCTQIDLGVWSMEAL